MKAATRTSRSRMRHLSALLLLVAPLVGCGGHWDMSWNESGCRPRHTGFSGHAHIEGDALGAAIILGVAGIAWGVGELLEAVGCK